MPVTGVNDGLPHSMDFAAGNPSGGVKIIGLVEIDDIISPLDQRFCQVNYFRIRVALRHCSRQIKEAVHVASQPLPLSLDMADGIQARYHNKISFLDFDPNVALGGKVAGRFIAMNTAENKQGRAFFFPEINGLSPPGWSAQKICSADNGRG